MTMTIREGTLKPSLDQNACSSAGSQHGAADQPDAQVAVVRQRNAFVFSDLSPSFVLVSRLRRQELSDRL